jgi:hypothetical protein
MQRDDKGRLARLRLRARRRRDGELRRRALFLSLSLFALLWVAVFAQMVSGHDPVLSGAKQAATSSQADRTARREKSNSEGNVSLALNPQTGTIQEVPSDSGSSSTATQGAPVTPAPVVTSQS